MFKTTTFALLIGSIAIFSSAHAGEVGLSFENNSTLGAEENTTLGAEENTTLGAEENTTLGAEENTTLNADGSGPAPSLPTPSNIAAEMQGGWDLFDVPMVK